MFSKQAGKHSGGSRDGTVARALASRQSDPGLIPELGGLSFLLVLVLALRVKGFSSGTPVFPTSQKSTFPNSNWIQNPWATHLLAACEQALEWVIQCRAERKPGERSGPSLVWGQAISHLGACHRLVC